MPWRYSRVLRSVRLSNFCKIFCSPITWASLQTDFQPNILRILKTCYNDPTVSTYAWIPSIYLHRYLIIFRHRDAEHDGCRCLKNVVPFSPTSATHIGNIINCKVQVSNGKGDFIKSTNADMGAQNILFCRLIVGHPNSIQII